MFTSCLRQYVDGKILLSLSGVARLARANAARAWRRIPNTVCESVSYFKKAEGDASAWGKAVATVDTSAARALAYNWCMSSYERIESNDKFQGLGALRKVIDEDSSHTLIFVNLVRLGGVLADRVFASTFSWRQEDDGSFLIAWAPVEEVGNATSSKATRPLPPDVQP